MLIQCMQLQYQYSTFTPSIIDKVHSNNPELALSAVYDIERLLVNERSLISLCKQYMRTLYLYLEQ